MNNTKKQLMLVLIALPILLIVTLVVFLNSLTRGFESESLQTLEEVSAQSVNAVQTEIYNKMYLLEDLAATVDLDFTAEDETISSDISAQLSPIVRNHEFYNMGVVTADGTVYTSDGAVTTTDELSYLDSLTTGDTNISGRMLLAENGDTYINIYSAPILDDADGQSSAVLYAVYETGRFRQTLEISSYHGEGYLYVINANGDVVVNSDNPNAFQDMDNLFTSMSDVSTDRNTTATRQLRGMISSHKSGYITFQNAGVSKYMYCEPVGINDWYLLTVVPTSVVNEQFYEIVYSSVVFAIIIILLYSVLMIYIVNQQKRKQTELANLAYVDPLTGGYTLAKFKEEYTALTKNHMDKKYALINMDLNKFEMFNDLYGYEEGNELIKMLDSLWREQLRDFECCGHRMADRFVILLTYDDRLDLVTRLENYRKRLQESVDGKYKLNLIIGIYELRAYEEDFEFAFNRAMMAFSTAKNNSTNWMKFYDEAMEEGLVWERYVEDHFQTALKNREFQVYYQAKVDAATGMVSGAEALVRWVRPDGTIVSPGRFISVLENNGSIAELDRYMFQEVLNHQKDWLEQGIPIVPVSVNLSRVQLAEQNFVSRYKDMLEVSELPSKYISLEFTESAMFDNEDVLRDTVDQLHGLGIKVLIDDFGVGFSSMMTLKSIPVDVMKMDKTFVDSIGDERGDKIVVGMIKFALSLGMSVTAEGVEDERQYQFLKSHHCHDIQGYYFAKPIPAHEYCDKYLLTA